MNTNFHFAFPIKDLNETKEFYCGLLGCTIGRSTTKWMDFNFFGHQLTVHVNPDLVKPVPFLKVDNQAFPPYHFGVILDWRDWHNMVERLAKRNVPFVIDPKTVFEGEAGEQKTMFIEDPNGYFIEFKSFENSTSVFSTERMC